MAARLRDKNRLLVRAKLQTRFRSEQPRRRAVVWRNIFDTAFDA